MPIVEPEVLMDADNSLEVCWEVTTRTLHETFDALYDLALDLGGTLLKPNMVIPGKGSPGPGLHRADRGGQRLRASAASSRRPSRGSCSCPEASRRCRRPRT